MNTSPKFNGPEPQRIITPRGDLIHYFDATCADGLPAFKLWDGSEWQTFRLTPDPASQT